MAQEANADAKRVETQEQNLRLAEHIFFERVGNRFARYTLQISKSHLDASAPFVVELFCDKTTFRCRGFFLSECFEAILDSLGIQKYSGPLCPVVTTNPALQMRSTVTHTTIKGQS